jgi:hypothetical protein
MKYMSLKEYAKKRKMVVISGLTTAGKTTTSFELAKVLPEWVFIDIWTIKNIFEPLGLKDREDIISISKKALVLLTREVIRKMHRNILLQETKKDFVKRHLGKDLKKYNYEIYSFFLYVPLKSAIKRDIEREKPTIGISKKGWTEQSWFDKAKSKMQKGDIFIDTSKNNVKQVVAKILKEIGEKPKKHPNKRFIQKYW